MNEKEWWDRRGDGGRKGLIGLKTFFSNFIIILNKKRYELSPFCKLKHSSNIFDGHQLHGRSKLQVL